jgi:hypothetical protein
MRHPTNPRAPLVRWSGIMTKTEQPPRTDETRQIEKLHGADRSGLGDKGWSETPADRVGGHPELETAPDPDAGGGLNGPQPATDVETGAAKPLRRDDPARNSSEAGSGVMDGASTADSQSSH